MRSSRWALLLRAPLLAADRIPIGYGSISGASIGIIKNALDDLANTDPTAKSAKPEQFIDTRFLDDIEKSGLLKKLYRWSID